MNIFSAFIAPTFAVWIEVGDDTFDVRAEEVSGRARDALYERQASLYPRFANYQRRTKTKIPVVALTERNRPS